MIALFERFVMRPTRKRIDKKFDILFWTLLKRTFFSCFVRQHLREGWAQSCRRSGCPGGWQKKRIWDELRVEKPMMEKNWGTFLQILSLLRSQSQIFVTRKTLLRCYVLLCSSSSSSSKWLFFSGIFSILVSVQPLLGIRRYDKVFCCKLVRWVTSRVGDGFTCIF